MEPGARSRRRRRLCSVDWGPGASAAPVPLRSRHGGFPAPDPYAGRAVEAADEAGEPGEPGGDGSAYDRHPRPFGRGRLVSWLRSRGPLDDVLHVTFHRPFEQLPGEGNPALGMDIAGVEPEPDLIAGPRERGRAAVLGPVDPTDPGPE